MLTVYMVVSLVLFLH